MTDAVKPCPVCGAPGLVDRPDLRILNATCTGCDWHYSTRLPLEPSCELCECELPGRIAGGEPIYCDACAGRIARGEVEP